MVDLESRGRASSIVVTRTADVLDYAAGDVVGPAVATTAIQTFAKIAPSGGGTILIRSATLEIDAAAVVSGETSYLLQLYSAAAPSALGDNVAWDLPAGDRGTYLGPLSLGTPVDVGSSLYVRTEGINMEIQLPGESLFAYLVTVGAYVPTSGRVFRVKLLTEAL